MSVNPDKSALVEFAEDCQERLWAIESGLLELEGDNYEILHELLRLIVSIRYGAQSLYLTNIEDTARRLATYLKQIRDYHLPTDRELVTLLLKVFYHLQFLIKQVGISGRMEIDKGESNGEFAIILKRLDARVKRLLRPIQFLSQIEEIFPLKSSVQKAASEYGKQVIVHIVGGEVAVPTKIMKHLPRLLSHLINNAIAHGIESPQKREAAGKSPVGKIILRAYYNESNKLVISFADDGAGINVEHVKSKAIAKGIITKSQADLLSTAEVYELLFQPDFSTKDRRDLRAGTGYGLDIVRTEIEKNGGYIKVHSIMGKGTTFTTIYVT